MAPLRCAAKFEPFLSLECAGVEDGGQILQSGNLGWTREACKYRGTSEISPWKKRANQSRHFKKAVFPSGIRPSFFFGGACAV